MRIFLSFCFLILVFGNVFSVGDTIYYNDHWNKCSRDAAAYYRIVELTTGSNHPFLIRDFYVNDTLQMIGFFSSLEPETKQGEFKYFHENGRLSQVSTYIDGKMNGFIAWYYENGNLRETGIYKNGIAFGENITYYDNGSLKAKGPNVSDKKEGLWVYWYKNGNIKAKGPYKNDSKTGHWKYWHENNQLKCVGKHKKGLATGKWTYWHDNGLKQSQGRFKAGLLAGKWIYWYGSGVINMVGLYKKGELTGNWLYFDEEGRMIAQQNMKDKNFIVTHKPEMFDTTINILANWKIGDKRNIEIIQQNKTYSGDSVIKEETTYYDVEVQITGKINQGYQAEWRYVSLYSKNELMVSTLINQKDIDIVRGIFTNLIFRFELDGSGSFSKIINKNNIRQQLHASADSIFKHQLNTGQLNLYSYNYKELEQKFNSMKYKLFTDDFIENELTREIKLFFDQNGKTYQTGQKIRMMSLVDFLGVKSPSKKFIEPLSIDKSNNLLTMELKKSVSPMNQYPGNFDNNQTVSFKVEETNNFTINYHTGWIKSIFRKNVLEVGELKTIQTLEIR